ncbi:protein kinase [Microbacterium sp.]|uniref:serine/threonine-protein kinase n=1 Tax=Microbacterium sp. TaxID=51671 RepID=UPI0035B482B2
MPPVDGETGGRTMSDLREAGELSTGEILDHRYVLRERIGEGGMARVYRADDEALGRAVAIKVLRDVDAIGSLDRARSETTLLASLNHHGLVTLFDAHISDDTVSYLVMEYVEGITLRERIAQGPIPPPQVASIAVDLAEALHVAHSAGIVHRDIKPSNVLLWKSPLPGREWRAKLADFGIAHLLDSARVTTPGMIIGTVAYVAPEQARGDAPAPPADIYALGLLLMEALTGERPFADAEGIGAVMARLAAPPEVPGSLEPEWRGLLRGMTAMRPEDRPSALEVAITAERLALGEAPLPASLADEPTQQAAILDTGPTRLLPAAAAVEGGVTAPIAPPLPPAVPPAGALPTAAPPASDDQRPRTRLIAIIVAALLVIGVATAALWWSAQMGADGSEPQPSPSVVDTPEPQPSETPADTPAPAEEEGAGDDGGAGTGNDNSGPGNNNGNGNGGGNSGNGNGGGNGNGP